ncbi:MAG: outer membrane beta-barrel protein [Bacteroidota bacterium]
MKKILIILFVALFSVDGYTQTENKKSLNPGFEIGVNYSLLQAEKELPSNYVIDNSAGFQFALNLEWKLLEALSIQPSLGLSMNKSLVTTTGFNLHYNTSYYDVFPVALEGGLRTLYYPFQTNKKPFISAGLLYMQPLEKLYSSTSYGYGKNFALDIGFGIQNSFGKLNLSPEIRYTLGLSNVNRNPAFSDLSYNRIAVIFTFN